jgi:transposase
MDSHTNRTFDRLEIVETGRRRRWSSAAKERIVLESLSGPRQVSATARRHGISRSLLVIWRRAFLARQSRSMPGFVSAVITPDIVSVPAVSPEMVAPILPPPTVPAPPPRIEIMLKNGQRIIVEGPLDIEALLKLARGLEALR